MIIYNGEVIDSHVMYSFGIWCSIPSQGPRHTKDVLKMVPVVPLFSTEHLKGKILALSLELR